MTYESNIAYTMRFMIDTKVRNGAGDSQVDAENERRW